MKDSMSVASTENNASSSSGPPLSLPANLAKLFECLRHGGPMTCLEVSKETGFDKDYTHRLLGNMVRHGTAETRTVEGLQGADLSIVYQLRGSEAPVVQAIDKKVSSLMPALVVAPPEPRASSSQTRPESVRPTLDHEGTVEDRTSDFHRKFNSMTIDSPVVVAILNVMGDEFLTIRQVSEKVGRNGTSVRYGLRFLAHHRLVECRKESANGPFNNTHLLYRATPCGETENTKKTLIPLVKIHEKAPVNDSVASRASSSVKEKIASRTSSSTAVRHSGSSHERFESKFPRVRKKHAMKRLVSLLSPEPQTVTDLADKLGTPRSTIASYIGVLEQKKKVVASVVETSRPGTFCKAYRLSDQRDMAPQEVPRVSTIRSTIKDGLPRDAGDRKVYDAVGIGTTNKDICKKSGYEVGAVSWALSRLINSNLVTKSLSIPDQPPSRHNPMRYTRVDLEPKVTTKSAGKTRHEASVVPAREGKPTVATVATTTTTKILPVAKSIRSDETPTTTKDGSTRERIVRLLTSRPCSRAELSRATALPVEEIDRALDIMNRTNQVQWADNPYPFAPEENKVLFSLKASAP